MRRTLPFLIIVLTIVTILPVVTHASNVPVPGGGGGGSAPIQNPGQAFAGVVRIAFMGAGVSALLILIYAAARLTVSGGNPSARKDARDWVIAVVFGLAILVFGGILLNTIR